MNPVLSVAFVMVLLGFAKERLNLKGASIWLFAIFFAVLVAIFPLLVGLFPPAAPWLEAGWGALMLVLAAAGTFDTIVDIKKKV